MLAIKRGRAAAAVGGAQQRKRANADDGEEYGVTLKGLLRQPSFGGGKL